MQPTVLKAKHSLAIKVFHITFEWKQFFCCHKIYETAFKICSA